MNNYTKKHITVSSVTEPTKAIRQVRPIVIAITAVLSLSVVGCSTSPSGQQVKRTATVSKKPSFQQASKTYRYSNTQKIDAQVLGTESALDDESLDELESLLQATDMQMVEDSRLAVLRYGNLWKRIRAGFKLDLTVRNARIEAQKSWFTSRQQYIDRMTARASRYFYYTITEAERRGIPTELALLPVIESSYDPTATSNAAAAGMWQFIPSTGLIYGLKQTGSYDGRRDVIESTRAAYDFLTSLYNKFGSWELALAAYNAGPGRVQKAIDYNRSRGRSTDYWSLKLPKETMNYVPRFLAVAQIVNQPDQYGVQLPSIANRPHFRSVPAQTGVSLNDISRITSVPLESLKQLNPALTNERIDVSGSNRVLIPNSVKHNMDVKITALAGYGQGFTALKSDSIATFSSNDAGELMASALSSDKMLPKIQQSASGTPDVSSRSTTNDTLAATQQAFKNYSNIDLPSTPDDLANFAEKASKITQTTDYIAPKLTPAPQNQQTIEPPVSQSEQQRLLNILLAEQNNLPTTRAQVTANETIIQEPALSTQQTEEIVKEIKANNPEVGEVIDPIDGKIKLSAIQTQQSILEAKGAERVLVFDSPAASAAASKPQGKRTTYRVVRGDTLVNIASRAGVSWRDIATWNQIDPQRPLYVGTQLYLYDAKEVSPLVSRQAPKASQSTSSRPDSYIVQSGDTLVSIADKFNLYTKDLAAYNNLSPLADVYINQKLWLVAGKVSDSVSEPYDTTSTKPSLALPSSQVDTVSHTVKSGESLIGIANQLGVRASDIAAVNSFDQNHRLLRGQVIQVPKTMTTYQVQSGDGLINLAKRFGISTKTLADANGLSTRASLIKGQKLVIPLTDNVRVSSQSGDVTSSKPNVSNKVASVDSSRFSERYIVQAGDGLITLAKRFGVSTSQLAAANNLSPKASLLRGQRLKVPARYTSYTVKSGDSLIRLAKSRGMTTTALADLNNLSPKAELKIGQKLKLPTK